MSVQHHHRRQQHGFLTIYLLLIVIVNFLLAIPRWPVLICAPIIYFVAFLA